MMMNNMMMSAILAEDVGAPEIRSPYNSGMRSTESWLTKFFGKLFKTEN